MIYKYYCLGVKVASICNFNYICIPKHYTDTYKHIYVHKNGIHTMAT